jgi:hypothetical protein
MAPERSAQGPVHPLPGDQYKNYANRGLARSLSVPPQTGLIALGPGKELDRSEPALVVPAIDFSEKALRFSKAEEPLETGSIDWG